MPLRRPRTDLEWAVATGWALAIVDTEFAVEQVGVRPNGVRPGSLDEQGESNGDRVDYVLLGEARGTTASSTILDLTGEPTILQSGEVDADEPAVGLVGLERAADVSIRASP